MWFVLKLAQTFYSLVFNVCICSCCFMGPSKRSGKRSFISQNSQSGVLTQSSVSLAHSYRFHHSLTGEPAETIHLITLRLPRRPPRHGVTRWHRSLPPICPNLPTPREAEAAQIVTLMWLRRHSGPRCSRASAVLRPIWPRLRARMQRLCECAVGLLTVCDESLTILPTLHPTTDFTL